MNRILTFLIIIIILTIILGCSNKQPEISILSPIDSLGWNEDEYGLAGASGIIKIGDYFVVSDLTLSEIALFKRDDLSFVRAISTKGNGPKEVFFPFGIVAHGENIIVNDLGNARIKEIDLEGNLVSNYKGIRSSIVFCLEDEIFFSPYGIGKGTDMISLIRNSKIESFLNGNQIYDKYVEYNDEELHYINLCLSPNGYVMGFTNSRKTILYTDWESGEIEVWDEILKSGLEVIMNITFYQEHYYLLVINNEDFGKDEPGNLPRLLKVDEKGKLLSTIEINAFYVGTNCFSVIDKKLYLYDPDAGGIMIFDLQGF